MKSEYYKNILPWNENERVIDQFGWNIQSIITPTASSKNDWSDAYLPSWESKRQIYDTAAENRLPKGVLMSEFHAGLCENIVHYWSMVGDTIVDPFAGRLTRAFVSQTLGRNYYGYDVSPETVKRVRHELDRHELGATIYEEDGCEMKSTPNESANLVLTCPPYADIERYESAEGQLSDIRKYDEFCERIQVCGDNIERVLKPGGFAVWVCGDFRKDGEYKSFHSDTINMFKKSGLKLHDIIVMRNNTIFAALQAGKCASKRYTAKVHEFILVFRKEGELEYSSDTIKNREESLEQFFK